jgi:hypothetical protein
MSVVHCKREAYDVYIGRGRDPRSGEPGEWGNPFSHRPSRVAGIVVVGSVEEAIARYRHYLWEEISSGRLPLARLAALHGKRLGCWCAPRGCHGEVLEAAAFWALGQQARRLERRVAELTRHAGGSGSGEG